MTDMITTADPLTQPNELKRQWQRVFLITAGVYAFGIVFYRVIPASGLRLIPTTGGVLGLGLLKTASLFSAFDRGSWSSSSICAGGEARMGQWPKLVTQKTPRRPIPGVG